MKKNVSIIRLAVGLALAAPVGARAAVPLGNEFQINETTTNAQQAPRIAFNPANGQYVVVWQSGDQEIGSEVFVRRYDMSGNVLGGELQVNTTTAGDQANPVVAPLPDGGFGVFWEAFDQDGESFAVFGRHFGSSGAPAGPEFQVNTLTLN
jgi:hypothetical protein